MLVYAVAVQKTRRTKNAEHSVSARSGAALAASVRMADVVGHAAVFRQPSEDLGFVEFIEPDALDDADLEDVTANAEHDDRMLLAGLSAARLASRSMRMD